MASWAQLLYCNKLNCTTCGNPKPLRSQTNKKKRGEMNDKVMGMNKRRKQESIF